MSTPHWLLLGLAALLLFWMVGAHNRVVALRNGIVTAWAQCDDLLLRRAAALEPALIALRPLMPAEAAAIDAVSQALAQVGAGALALRPRPAQATAAATLAAAEGQFTSAMARLQALVEHDAAARTEPAVSAALATLRDLTPRLIYARQAFNDAGAVYNAAVDQFPTRLLRPVFRFEDAGAL